MLAPGIYVPTVVFFDRETEDLDIDTIKSHAVRLAKAGVAGITTQGSNGEAVHLSNQERIAVTKATRQALDDNGFTDMPVIAGCGAQSTREAIQFCQEAASAGGQYALVLPPSYYKASYTHKSILDFFTTVASASPIPILIYNYPGAVAGIDLSSDDIIELAKHPKIVGCKLTCGNTGKLNRIAHSAGSNFATMGGSADFILQTLIAGGVGIIGGTGNIAPKACVKVMDLYQAGKVAEAQKLQAIVARGDWNAITGGIVGTKAALQHYFGYGGVARDPLPKPSEAEAAELAAGWKEIVELEATL